MTLTEKLLPKLSDWHPAGDGRHSWAGSFPEAGWSVQLVADKADTLSCLVWELALTRSGDAPPGLSLTQWANAVASRVNGLMEPLKVLEVDAQHGVATLRSAVPTVKHDAVTYYEVRLNGLESAVVRRYTASKTATGRMQLAFALTHEAIAKLAGDVAG